MGGLLALTWVAVNRLPTVPAMAGLAGRLGVVVITGLPAEVIVVVMARLTLPAEVTAWTV